jgi:hypothetical protein
MRKLALSVAVLAGVAVGATAVARPVPKWPYEKLMVQADLVVIGVPVKTVETDDKYPQDQWPREFVGQNTTFDVKHVIKGKVDDKQIKLLHFKFGKLKKGLDPDDVGNQVIKNGPDFVTFRLKDPLEHLLFVKATKDGRFEPVSGQIDPTKSIRVLVEP